MTADNQRLELFPVVDEQGEPISLPLYVSDFTVGQPMDGEQMFDLFRSRGVSEKQLHCLYLYLRDWRDACRSKSPEGDTLH